MARPGERERWKVAHGSLNLFWMLGLPTMFSAVSDDAMGRTPGVILSDEVWRRDFGANPHIAGRLVHVGRNDVRVLGVSPAGASGGFPAKSTHGCSKGMTPIAASAM